METKRLVLCDTDVLINLFRRDAGVEAVFTRYNEERFVLSSITAAEIYFGMKRKEARQTKELIGRFNLIYIDKPICQRMLDITFTYTNQLSIADAIVASTAIEYGFDLYTFNRQDYDFLPGIHFFNPN